MTTSSYYRNFRERLFPVYETGEASAIADLVFEHFTGISRSQRSKEPECIISEESIRSLESAMSQLLTHRPVQYVLNEAWFYGHRFFVDESVLVPRPETELLVEQVIATAKQSAHTTGDIRIIDIGTGSGCIAISIKKSLPAVEMLAMDYSHAALETAKKNAHSLEAGVLFTEADITNPTGWQHLPSFNIVVSNPPYIPHDDLPEMKRHVTDFEPASALFVPANDALFFYRHILSFCTKKLLPGGWLFCEIHENYGKEVAGLLQQNGFTNVGVVKDLFDKERMVCGAYPK
jgi:release factor glutamine methyltransferase